MKNSNKKYTTPYINVCSNIANEEIASFVIGNNNPASTPWEDEEIYD